MRVAIGSDHRGVQLKAKVREVLEAKGCTLTDEGAHSQDSVDYPDFAAAVCRKVCDGEAERGILICGTGIGMAITANKFPGIRAAACNDELSAEMSRRHNDLNVLCLAADILGNRNIDRLLEIWISTEFEGGRHARRIGKIGDMERKNDCRSD